MNYKTVTIKEARNKFPKVMLKRRKEINRLRREGNVLTLSDMSTATLTKKEIKQTIHDGVKEALQTEFMKFRSLFVPHVSNIEQKDIEKRYKVPKKTIAKTYEVEI